VISLERFKLESTNFAHRMTNHPKRGVVKVTQPIFNFYICNHIPGTAEARVVKSCMQVEYIKCQPLDDRLLLMGVVRVT